MAWHVRPVERSEFVAVGDLLCEAYVSAGLEVFGGPYLPILRDVERRVADPRARVLVAVADGKSSTDESGTVLGSVTVCGHGSDLTSVCCSGEFEFRMLGVTQSRRRAGIAAALIDACDDHGADLGLTTAVGCASDGNSAAISLYRSLGFAAAPERDHHYSPDEFLRVFSRPAEFCGQCGRSARASDHGFCRTTADLEPDRFCETCRRRMKVQVMPTGWTATCSRHGTIAG